MIWSGRANSRRVKYKAAALYISAALIGSFPVAGAAELSGGVVRIGIINDQTGPLSDLSGPGSIAAAKMAAEDFQKLVPSIKVEIVAADHQNKPDIGVGIVRKWFDVDGVDMVADVSNSAVGLAIQSLARDKNKIAVYSAVATTELNGKQCSRNGLAWLHDSYNVGTDPYAGLSGVRYVVLHCGRLRVRQEHGAGVAARARGDRRQVARRGVSPDRQRGL
jgi:branched-chain amino acid transport system substrate-binding protein